MRFDEVVELLGAEPWFGLATVTQLVAEPRVSVVSQLHRWGRVAAIGRGVLHAAGTVTSITVTNPGLGYTSSVQTCTPSSPAAGGSQATSIGVTLEDRVLSVTLTNPGHGYTVLPDCAIAAPGTGPGGGRPATPSSTTCTGRAKRSTARRW